MSILPFYGIMANFYGIMANMDPAKHQSKPLSEEDRAALERAGFDLREFTGKGRDPLTETQRDLETLVADSFDTEQLKAILSSDTQDDQAQACVLSEMYSFEYDGATYYPAFQLNQGALIQGMKEVVEKLDPDLHPIAVLNWFHLPNIDLYSDPQETEPISPIDWLRRGEDVSKLVILAGEL